MFWGGAFPNSSYVMQRDADLLFPSTNRSAPRCKCTDMVVCTSNPYDVLKNRISDWLCAFPTAVVQIVRTHNIMLFGSFEVLKVINRISLFY